MSRALFRLSQLPPLALALGLAACGGGSARGCSFVPGYGAAGELGRGQFTYVCTTNDQACVDAANDTTIRVPYAVAEGATFRLGYLPLEGEPTAARLQPASGLLLREDQGLFMAQRVGTEAVFARGPGATIEPVVDLVHVRVQAPTRVRFLVDEPVHTIWLRQPERVLTVVEGEPVAVRGSSRARHQDARALLAGVAAHTTSADPSVVAVEPLAHGAVRLVGTGVGETVVTASYGSLSSTLRVRVVPGGPFVRDAGAIEPPERNEVHAALD